MRLLIRLIAAAALVSLALPAAAQDKVRLLLDWFVNPDHAALVIAKQRGIFTKHGLDVELIAPADPNAPPKLVAAGQAEYALSYQPTLQMLAPVRISLCSSADLLVRIHIVGWPRSTSSTPGRASSICLR